MHKQSLLATFYFALAVLLQATIGNFPLSLAFPFNVIWIMAWGYLLQHLYKEGSRPILSHVDVAFMSGDLYNHNN